MKEGDSLSLGAGARYLVDETDAGCAAALEGGIEIVDREADVMDTRTAFRDELRDRRIRRVCLEKFDERRAGRQAGDLCPVGVAKRNVSEPEHVAVKRYAVVKTAHGDSDVRDSGAGPGRFLHGQLNLRRTPIAKK